MPDNNLSDKSFWQGDPNSVSQKLSTAFPKFNALPAEDRQWYVQKMQQRFGVKSGPQRLEGSTWVFPEAGIGHDIERGIERTIVPVNKFVEGASGLASKGMHAIGIKDTPLADWLAQTAREKNEYIGKDLAADTAAGYGPTGATGRIAEGATGALGEVAMAAYGGRTPVGLGAISAVQAAPEGPGAMIEKGIEGYYGGKLAHGIGKGGEKILKRVPIPSAAKRALSGAATGGVLGAPGGVEGAASGAVVGGGLSATQAGPEGRGKVREGFFEGFSDVPKQAKINLSKPEQAEFSRRQKETSIGKPAPNNEKIARDLYKQIRAMHAVIDDPNTPQEIKDSTRERLAEVSAASKALYEQSLRASNDRLNPAPRASVNTDPIAQRANQFQARDEINAIRKRRIDLLEEEYTHPNTTEARREELNDQMQTLHRLIDESRQTWTPPPPTRGESFAGAPRLPEATLRKPQSGEVDDYGSPIQYRNIHRGLPAPLTTQPIDTFSKASGLPVTEVEKLARLDADALTKRRQFLNNLLTSETSPLAEPAQAKRTAGMGPETQEFTASRERKTAAPTKGRTGPDPSRNRIAVENELRAIDLLIEDRRIASGQQYGPGTPGSGEPQPPYREFRMGADNDTTYRPQTTFPPPAPPQLGAAPEGATPSVTPGPPPPFKTRGTADEGQAPVGRAVVPEAAPERKPLDIRDAHAMVSYGKPYAEITPEQQRRIDSLAGAQPSASPRVDEPPAAAPAPPVKKARAPRKAATPEVTPVSEAPQAPPPGPARPPIRPPTPATPPPAAPVEAPPPAFSPSSYEEEARSGRPFDPAKDTTVRTPESIARADAAHNRLWNQVQDGVTDNPDGPSHLLQAAKTIRDGGGLKDQKEFIRFYVDFAASPRSKSGNLTESALRGLIGKYAPSITPPAPPIKKARTAKPKVTVQAAPEAPAASVEPPPPVKKARATPAADKPPVKPKRSAAYKAKHPMAALWNEDAPPEVSRETSKETKAEEKPAVNPALKQKFSDPAPPEAEKPAAAAPRIEYEVSHDGSQHTIRVIDASGESRTFSAPTKERAVANAERVGVVKPGQEIPEPVIAKEPTAEPPKTEKKKSKAQQDAEYKRQTDITKLAKEASTITQDQLDQFYAMADDFGPRWEGIKDRADNIQYEIDHNRRPRPADIRELLTAVNPEIAARIMGW